MSPRSSFPQVYLLDQDGTLPVRLQGNVSGSLIRSVHEHRIVLGLKVGVPEVNFKEDGIARTPLPNQVWIIPNYMGASHGPAEAQIRSQNILHDRDLVKTTAQKLHVTAQLSP